VAASVEHRRGTRTAENPLSTGEAIATSLNVLDAEGSSATCRAGSGLQETTG
jgi:hypothetical protein